MTLNQHLADLLGLDLTDPEVTAALAEQREITAIRARVHEVLTRTGTTEGKLVALLGITADKTRASLAGDRRWSTYELAVIATHGGTTVEWLCGEYPDYEYVESPDDAWYRALPIEARVEFEDELAATPDADRATMLAAWRSTGEVYADPELLAALSSDSGDDDPMAPETAAGLADLRDRPEVFGGADDEPAEPNPRIQAAAAEMRAEQAPTPERDGYTIAVYLPPGVRTDVRDYLFQAIGDLAHTADWHQGWDAHVVGQAGDPLGAVDGKRR